MNAMDRFAEVLIETPKVREELGFPPLVTPTSQMVGVQAANNVLSGERYKNVTKEVAAYLRGEYGTPPGKVNEELVKKVLGDEQPYTGRFADTLAPGFEAGKAQIGAKAKTDEDVLSYIIFPQVYEKFVDDREEKKKKRVQYSIEQV